jgi:cytochrome P450
MAEIDGTAPLDPGLNSQWRNEAVFVGGPTAWRARLGFLRNPVRAVEDCHRRLGPVVAFTASGPRLTSIRHLLLIGPEYNRQILTNTEWLRPSGLWSVPGPRGSVQRAMKFNYVTASGSEHVGLKKTLVPMLSRQRVTAQFEAIRTITSQCVAGWPVGREVDLYSLAREAGQQTAFTVLFGDTNLDRIRAFGDMVAQYHDANWRATAYVPFRIPGLPYARVLSQAEKLRDFVREWVGEQGGCPADQDLRSAFAAHRTGEGVPLSADQLASHITFVAFAAYETMSSALTWVLFLLAFHPRVLADLSDEIAAAPPVEAITQEQLASLPLLDGVVKESLRLVPPTPVLLWRTSRDWETGGARLARGTQIILSPHVTHRIPEIYDSPRAFRPDRWARIKPTPYEYLPFGAGPRRCPGHNFAAEFMKLAVATFLPRFRLEAGRSARFDYVYRGIMMPRPGIAVRFLPQDRAFGMVRAQGSIRDLVDLDGLS